ncbi:hypothetical protein A3758_17365 [Oleiphilus sp. HI0118]|nr:hypothetical protein A3758_17365 [Oleiphilus sp. HI0118]
MKHKIILLSAAALLVASSIAHAVGPGKGSLTKRNVNVGGCQASTVKVAWALDSLMGEPTVNAEYIWYGDSNCKPAHSTVLWLEVTQRSGAGSGFVRVSPVAPRAGKSSYDTTGSPDWDELLCGYDGTRRSGCHTASDAKTIWKKSKVVDFKFQY